MSWMRAAFADFRIGWSELGLANSAACDWLERPPASGYGLKAAVVEYGRDSRKVTDRIVAPTCAITEYICVLKRGPSKCLQNRPHLTANAPPTTWLHHHSQQSIRCSSRNPQNRPKRHPPPNQQSRLKRDRKPSPNLSPRNSPHQRPIIELHQTQQLHEQDQPSK